MFNLPRSWFDAPRGILFPEPPAFTVRGLKYVLKSKYQIKLSEKGALEAKANIMDKMCAIIYHLMI